MKVAVVEDDASASGTLEQYFTKLSEETQTPFAVEVYPNAVSFLSEFRSDFDIILMDIEMPYIDGMEAARRLRKLDRDVTLLFVTNMAQFAVKGYEVDAYDFVVKPVTYPEFKMKIQDAVEHTRKKTETYLSIPVAEKILRISSASIRYVEVRGHVLEFHTDDGIISARGSLQKLEGDRELGFLRCNNCYLVNPRRITRVGKNFVYLGEDALAISRPRKTEFLRLVAEYFASGG